MNLQDVAPQALRSLVDVDGVRGACLLHRDGAVLHAHWPHNGDVETLAAMGAALMGAAEASLREFGQDAQTVLVVAQGLRLVVLGVDDDSLLLAATERHIPIEAIDRDLQEALQQLADPRKE